MNILVFDPDPVRLQQTIEALANYTVTSVQQQQDFVQLIGEQQAVILHEEVDTSLVASLVRQHPGVVFIVGMVRKSIHGIRVWLQEVGVKECLRYPLTKAAVEDVLNRYGVAPRLPQEAAAIAEEQAAPEAAPAAPKAKPAKSWRHAPKEETEQQTPQSAPAPQQPADEQPVEEEEDLGFTPTEQEVVAVTSARGGVGKSTIAYNMAALAAAQGIRTVIVDIDPRGNMVSISNTKFRYTADQWDRIDAENDGEKTVLNLLAPMDCGAYLLPSGKRVNGMASETLEKVLRLLQRYFELIIIDCEPRFTPTTLLAYQMATKVLMVTPDDIAAYGRIIEKVHQMREVEIDTKKIKLVINRVEKSFDKEEEAILVERSMCKVLAKLPVSGDIRKLQKQGRAAVSNSKSAFTKQMKVLLSRVIVISPKKAQKKPAGGGLLRKLFQKSS